uniref:Peptidase_M28 domain-containing protein n=1 Tax=Mesocestoides corti TaxID=53468 RepID=A0A5K3F5S2_MESCO
MEVRRRNVDIHDHIDRGFTSSSSTGTDSHSFYLVEPPQVSIHLWHWIIIFFTTLLCVTLIPLHSTSCGSNISSALDINSSFQEVFARKHLKFVTGLGPRTGGSVNNEVHARKYLRLEIEKIVRLAETSGLVAKFEEQISRPSYFQTHAHITSYANIPNLILRLHDPRVKRTSPARSILVNCHYDTVSQSPGASDAFVGCANSLEASRVLAHGLHNLNNDIIFLFNGAEENILPASHAFVTQHPWAADVVVFINLEGAGAGGKLLVFQSGPGPASSALIKLYSSSARYPFASVVGEELFRFGLIPSDTDFRIFRDYGSLPGLDLAYIGNGYAYHTCYDTEERISTSCLQLAGDNLLQLLKLMVQDPTIDYIDKLGYTKKAHPRKEIFSPEKASGSIHYFSNSPSYSNFSRLVYFDVLGYFVFKYPWDFGRILHWGVVFATTLWFFALQKRVGGTYAGLLLATLIQTIFFVSGHLFALFVGYVIHTYGCRMSWYTNRCNIFGIYLLPIITYFFFFHSVFFRIPSGPLWCLFPLKSLFLRSGWSDSTSIKARLVENDFFKGTVLTINVITVLSLLYDSPASYFTILWCAFTITSRFVYFLIFGDSGSHYFAKLLILLLPPLMVFHASSVFTLFEVFIPIMGRSGQVAQPDVIMSGLIAFSSLPVLLYCADVVHLTPPNVSRVLRQLLTNLCITFIVLVHTSSLGFPYAVLPSTDQHLVPPSLQRVAVIHANRQFRENISHPGISSKDSGVFVFPLDANRFHYYHHPPSSSPNPLLLKLRRYLSPGPTEPFYFPELQQLEPYTYRRDLPYCGVPLLYPLLNVFDTMYYLPAPRHKSPSATLSIIEQHFEVVADRASVNLTFSVDSSAPLTQLYLRTSPQFVQLESWSFAPDGSWPTPVPVPKRTSFEDPNAPRSAHFYVNHIDPSAATTKSGRWPQPWVFWLQFTVLSTAPDDRLTECSNCVDIAVVSQYLDDRVPNGVSEQVEKILQRLPQWAVPMHCVSSYDHCRVILRDSKIDFVKLI